MIDVSKTIAPKSDQLNADDLIASPMTIRVTKVSLLAGDMPIAISFEGDNGKPYKPCKSMRRVLVQIWGKDGNLYIGRSMTLYRDEKVVFGGQAVGGIRISHMSDISEAKTIALTASKAKRLPYTVQPLKTEQKPQINPDLKQQGDEAAKTGSAGYTAWLNSLKPEEKNPLREMHKTWSAIAKEVDNKGETNVQPE